jgi:hypothetical protein
MKYARVNENNIVIEIFNVPPGASINDCFVPVIADQFIAASDEVENGWVLGDDGIFTSSTPEEVIEEDPPEEVIEEDPPEEEPTVDG